MATIGVILSSSAALAQIPNGGFENWTNFGTYQDPTGWSSLNVLSVTLGGPVSCEQVPGATGTYGAKVTTVNIPGVGLLPGLLIIGDPDAGSDGFAFTTRPAALNGKWRTALGSGDQASVTVTLSRWNAATQERDVIGTGASVVSTNVAAWTNFSMPITYAGAADPDTASIFIISSLGASVAGSSISVDDLSFGAAVGISENFLGTVDVWPVPSTDVLNVSASLAFRTVELIAADGRLVKQVASLNDRLQLDIADLERGAYVLVARMADGSSFHRTVVKQ
jgi:hypothetical protein